METAGTKVSFGVAWQMYGRQTIVLPDTVNAGDKEEVMEYIESIWDDIPLPSGEYVMESDELDPDSIEIEEPDPDPIETEKPGPDSIEVEKPDPGQIRRIKKDDILEITLLSTEEYRKAKKDIPMLGVWWWLRTPGGRSDYVKCVTPNEDIDHCGRCVYCDMVSVRPALRIRPASVNLSIGSKFLFGGYPWTASEGDLWTVIAPGLALYDNCLCTMSFRKFHQEADANIYEYSDIKKYLDEWFADVEESAETKSSVKAKRDKRAAQEKLAKNAKPILFNTQMVKAILNGEKTETRRNLKNLNGSKPPYNPGDILYVRETWAYTDDGTGPRFVYRASGSEDNTCPKTWKPSIHMPKTAARIFLRITDIRLERLQDITTEGVRNEGIRDVPDEGARAAFKELWNSTLSPHAVNKSWEDNPYVWRIRFETIK